MGRDVAVMTHARNLGKDAKPQRIRVQRLIPLVATLVSKPEAARSLVLAAHAGGTSRPDASLRQLLEAVLWTAYDQATQSTVRARITLGAARMLDLSASETAGGAQHDMGRTAGTFLGTAASAEEAVGLEETTASAIERIVKLGGSVLPGYYKKVAEGAAFIIGKAAKDNETGWSNEVVNQLLYEVYSAVHPSPDGTGRPSNLPSDTPSQRAYQNEFEEWRVVPAQAFQNSYEEKR